MIDHLGVPARDLARSRAFFLAALAPLGIGVVMDVTAEQTGGSAHVGFGANGKPFFWLGDGHPAGGPVHVAFTAETPEAVRLFHRAAIAAGGTDNGAPGLRPHYHPDYYAAFIVDPDGNNVEAVCHTAG
ncbi:VOC family protein [Lichenifustis flavocetrariae]|uniref:VOC family protein n=1 Tax=Lichenifustis flavocetrariae TaxID=2949735 RepID=A0AA41YRV4_9HYPH|nr:VOC family protein [Lichenifustis flavocetrariae]MCW6507386.1 VOC family protein [Lichenifustis flavocetrariae]